MTEGKASLISLALLVLPSSPFFPAMHAGFPLGRASSRSALEAFADLAGKSVIVYPTGYAPVKRQG